MNDRFRFRAWDKTENTYIEDAQFTYDDGCEGGMGSFRHYSFRDLLEDKNCIIEQCTGLKDKNGKLIYEGDLIKETANKYSLEVFYENGAWQTREYRKNGKREQLLYVLINCYGVEVVGNIHENADLLEVEND